MSKIEWCDETINPIIGCSKKSSGCKNCYAEKMAVRLQAMGVRGYKDVVKDGKWTGRMNFVESEIDKPGKWKKPKRIFVGSMTDIFHDDVPFEWLNKLWDMFFENPQHIFIVLTKRPKRMREFVKKHAYRRHFGWIENDKKPFEFGELIHLDDLYYRNMCGYATSSDCNKYLCSNKQNEEYNNGIGGCCCSNCPIANSDPHVKDLEKIGIDNQYEIDEEGYSMDCDWMQLYARPKDAFIKNVWIGTTVENQIQANYRVPTLLDTPANVRFLSVEPMLSKVKIPNIKKLDWVICGGESGHGARELNPEWVRSLRDQCVEAGVPFFFKQWGGNNKKKNGRLLDGKIYEEFPK